jgi:hypothetical protein
LSEDEIPQRTKEAGAEYLDIDELLDEIGDAVGQLVDARRGWRAGDCARRR